MSTSPDTRPLPRIVDCWLCGEPVAAGVESCPHCGAPPPERRQREARQRQGRPSPQEIKAMLAERQKSQEKLRQAVAQARRTRDYSRLPQSVVDQLAQELLISTESTAVGMAIQRRIGLLVTDHLFGAGILRERNFAGVTDAAGERILSIQETLREARDECMLDLRRQALLAGADAVIGFSLTYTPIAGRSDGMMLVSACGTAVVTSADV